ncbi:MAG: metallophosphoesterase [Neisseria sp.]|uniref:metallophosphoesterase n=1 Tax=Neisseria sp. TaxID=192066 RepID=UPI0026DCD17A|nr:metallophosphoesterase [Neisseria sp.]MDO4641666.1 metallophosphoesterase [Neisseria sp.]
MQSVSYFPIQPLPAGSLDIIGDVHGEFSALQTLLAHLGYRANGSHPAGRRLVFVGDLCDRGPDSPATLAWFRQACEAGGALMVLGNHELNLLAQEPKDGSGWFFSERETKDGLLYAPWHRMSEEAKPALTDWLATMPLVLQRDDLRIVHAAWLPQAVEQVQTGMATDESLIDAYQRWDNELNQSLHSADWYAAYLREQADYAGLLDNPQQTPPPMPATAQFEYQRSRLHPVRALTSGVETLAKQPFYAGARWRFTERAAWWDNYTDDIPVVIGHYWRHWQPQPSSLMPEPANAWFGARHNVFCVDYSVGARWRDRRAEPPVSPSQSHFRLAALRWPEKVLMFDNGETVATI